MKKLGRSIIVSLISVFLITPSSYACVGARPMAMGGAFIGVADDANATYWNPAGLDQKKTEDEQEGIEITYTPTIHNRDEINYDDFVSLTTPIKLGQQDWGNLGLSFINTGYEGTGYDLNEHWYWLSYGKSLLWGLSLGVNLRYQDYDYEILGFTSEDNTFVVDLSLLWKLDKFSFGILWQDMNEPEVELFGVKGKYIRNLRPGIAFRPDDKTVIALDMYDATGETKDESGSVAYDFRLGVERWFDLPQGTPKWIGEWLGESIALRAGGYHINRGNRAYTFGLGLKGSPEDNFPKNIQLDYALIYWTDTPSGVDEFTHQIGLTFKF